LFYVLRCGLVRETKSATARRHKSPDAFEKAAMTAIVPLKNGGDICDAHHKSDVDVARESRQKVKKAAPTLHMSFFVHWSITS